jgi:hypothetical protein
MTVTGLVAEIRAFRPFLPAKEFQKSLRFYKAIGCHYSQRRLSGQL